MICSDEELQLREQKARELGMVVIAGYAMFAGSGRCLGLHTLTVYRAGYPHGPFTTMEEALNMLILLGGGPK